MTDYTLVVGVDAAHLEQLSCTWPTWARHKPSLLARPMLVFYDRRQVAEDQIRQVVDHPRLVLVPWQHRPIVQQTVAETDKWTDPQRYMMLAGFVYVPPMYVDTEYWLKLDTDTVATGRDDWVDSAWFADKPAIVAQPWGFTKPPEQMLELDRWAEQAAVKFRELRGTQPLDLAPASSESTRVCHKRIISWCGFFNTEFTGHAMVAAGMTCGYGHLPVRSQDGFHWYLAARLGKPVVRVQMKQLGWEHWSRLPGIREASWRALEKV